MLYVLKCVSAVLAVSSLVGLSGYAPVEQSTLTDTRLDRPAQTTLMSAVESGDLELVVEVLDDGAWPNQAAPDGWTPLMEAAVKGRPDLVRELLARGADPGARAANGWTALRAAVEGGNLEVVLTLADSLERAPRAPGGTRPH